MEDVITTQDKTWLIKMRNIGAILLVGFALGSITSNMTFTYHLQKDCELLKQFRVGNLAYTCMVK